MDWEQLWHRYQHDSAEALEGWLAGCPVARSGSGVPRVLVSACLLGYRVSYRGAAAACCGERRPANLLTQVLGARLGLLECVPLCPELRVLRLGAPRRPIRLVRLPPPAGLGSGGELAVVDSLSGREHFRYCPSDPQLWLRVEGLAAQRRAAAGSEWGARTEDYNDKEEWLPRDLDGALLKAKSPSCGLQDCQLFRQGHRASAGAPADTVYGDGFYSSALRAGVPGVCLTSERLLRFYDSGDAAEVGRHRAARERRRTKLEKKMMKKNTDAGATAVRIGEDDPRLPVAHASAQTCLVSFLDSVLSHYEERCLL